MNFEKLHKTIPYVTGGKSKVLEMKPHVNITLALPGRHAGDTVPAGGDYVVMVDDEEMNWTRHQFTNADIFVEIEKRYEANPTETTRFMRQYLKVVKGGYRPDNLPIIEDPENVVDARTMLCALQCLAVAEHRRYAKYESRFGGRYLPFRFSAGISEGLWTAADATSRAGRGRPGVEWLEKEFGVPELTKELMA